MAWIESHQEIGRHPKTKRLARYLGVSIPAAIGYLHLLWWWALDYAQDGDLSKYDLTDIADATFWEDAPDILINALYESDWLEKKEDGYLIHDWEEYAGRLLEKRRTDAERKRLARENKDKKQFDKDVQETSNGRPTDVEGTVPNRTVPYHTNIYSPEFEEFWSHYPRKIDKKLAYKAWGTRLKEKHKPSDIILAAKNYANTCRLDHREDKFIKHASTFLGPNKHFEEWVTVRPRERPPTENERQMAEIIKELEAQGRA